MNYTKPIIKLIDRRNYHIQNKNRSHITHNSEEHMSIVHFTDEIYTASFTYYT